MEVQQDAACLVGIERLILATYDGHETGVSEDNIDGGFIVNGEDEPA